MTIDMNEYPAIGARSAFFTPLFLGREGPVFGKGARAFRLGGRDWCLFTVARDLAGELRDKGYGDKADGLLELLEKSVAHTLAGEEDASRADTARVTLLREVAKLLSL